MPTYPHMCRMDHAEIGHSDSENELCPLCMEIARHAATRKQVEEADKALIWTTGHLKGVLPPGWTEETWEYPVYEQALARQEARDKEGK